MLRHAIEHFEKEEQNSWLRMKRGA